MSGHSKWSTIKHKKGAEDKRRGQLFTKLSRAIIVAAKEGGPDPDANATLATAVAKARSYSMPKDNIERAIARATGGGEGSDAYEAVIYEGYGPEGVAIIVEALTDNRNRTAADVRAIFTRSTLEPGRAGVGGLAVRAQGRDRGAGREVDRGRHRARGRRRRGRGRLPRRVDAWQVTTAPTELAAVRDALEAAGIADRRRPSCGGAADARSSSTRSGARKLLRLIDSLEDLDDVQEVYANFDIPEAVLEAVAG